MSHFPITRYRIEFKALQRIYFPEYAGSTLRGAFGHALKSIACLTAARHRGQCQCHPAESCLYRQLFDPPKRELKQQDRIQDIPPPFVVEAYHLKTQLAINEQAYFDMVLIGDFAHRQQMLIQLAWQRALAVGVGGHISTGQAQAELLNFYIYDQPQVHIEAKSQVRLNLITHVRLQHYGKFLNPENFDIQIFINSILRRYLICAETYYQLGNDNNLQKIYQNISKIRGEAQLKWVKWSRYSNRQKQSMRLDGLQGYIDLYDLPYELYYYLYLGQWLHTGKGCVFGLGQYQMIDL